MSKVVFSRTMTSVHVLDSYLINKKDIMTYEQPKLPYAPDALEPAISARTVEFHYGISIT